MQTVAEVTPTTSIMPTIEERIAALPETQPQRLKALQALLREQEHNVKIVTDEIIKVARNAIEQNMNPNGKLLAEISNRYTLSSEYGVSREDFDAVLAEISTNEKASTQLRRLKATGAEMTIISIDASEVLFTDTVDNVNVEAQEEFLSGLDTEERSDAVRTLQVRFSKIEQLLQRADGERGLHYYDYLLICEVTGAEPMPEDEYRELQNHKPVDRQTICWLLTKQEMLDRGGALCGFRDDRVVVVGGDVADRRDSVQAGRPRLRVHQLCTDFSHPPICRPTSSTVACVWKIFVSFMSLSSKQSRSLSMHVS